MADNTGTSAASLGVTNQLANGQAAGAVPGSPGTLPTTWAKGSNVNAANWALQVVGTGVDASTGVGYVDLRFTGNVTTGTGTVVLYTDTTTATRPVTEANLLHAFSFHAAWVSGTPPTGALLQYGADEATSAGAFVAGGTTIQSANIALTALTTTLQRRYGIRKTGAATAGKLAPYFSINSIPLGAFDFTLRLGGVQVERNPYPSAYQPTSAGAATAGTQSAPTTAGMNNAGSAVNVATVTNLLRATQDPSNSAWAKSQLTVTTGQADPFGGTGAALLARNATAAADPIFQYPGHTMEPGQTRTYTYSVWLRGAVGGEQITLTQHWQTYNSYLSNVTLTTSWVRYTFTQTIVSSAGNATTQLGAGLRIPASASIYVYGFQLEEGFTATLYLPNLSTGTAQRALTSTTSGQTFAASSAANVASYTNLAPYSEPLLANLNTSAGAITQAAFTEQGLSNGIQFPGGTLATNAYAYENVAAGISAGEGLTFTFSCYVVMDDGSAPKPGAGSNNPSADFTLVVAGYGTTHTVNQISGSLYRVSATATVAIPRTLTAWFGVLKYTGNTTKGFRVSGFQIEQTAGSAGAYVKTTGTAKGSGVLSASSGLYYRGDASALTLGRYNHLLSSQVAGTGWTFALTGTAVGVPQTATLNYATAPDGTLTATRLIMSNGGGTSSNDNVYQNAGIYGLGTGQNQTFSVWLRLTDPLAAPQKVGVSIAGFLTMATVTGTWQRFSNTYSGLLPGQASSVRIQLRGASGSDLSCDVLAWGAQTEDGAVPTALMPVAGVAGGSALAPTISGTFASQGTTALTLAQLVEQGAGLLSFPGAAAVQVATTRNLLRSSQDLTAGVWQRAGLTVEAGYPDPFGGFGAFKLTRDATVQTDPFGQLSEEAFIEPNSHRTFAYTVYLRSDTGGEVVTAVQYEGAVGAGAATSNATLTTAWVRKGIGVNFHENVAPIPTTPVRVGVGLRIPAGASIYVYGPQLELGGKSNPYIPTGADGGASHSTFASSAGTATPPYFTGDAATLLEALQGAGAGAVNPVGEAAALLASLAALADGRFTIPGAALTALERLVAQAAGQLTIPGQATWTLEQLLAEARGVHVAPRFPGQADTGLLQVLATATGTVHPTGRALAVLAVLVAQAEAFNVPHVGRAAATLARLLLEGLAHAEPPHFDAPALLQLTQLDAQVRAEFARPFDPDLDPYHLQTNLGAVRALVVSLARELHLQVDLSPELQL